MDSSTLQFKLFLVRIATLLALLAPWEPTNLAPHSLFHEAAFPWVECVYCRKIIFWFCFVSQINLVRLSRKLCIPSACRIGESLFTIFASLAKAIQFLMELQTYHFWILKDHFTINSATEYAPDIVNNFCAKQREQSKIRRIKIVRYL